MNKLNILQITNKPPYPPIDGGAICLNNLSFGLNDLGHYIKVVSVNTHKHYVNEIELPQSYKQISNIELVFIDTRIKIIDAFFNLFTDKSYHITRFYDANMASKLTDTLKETNFDFIIMESIFLIDYLEIVRANSTAKIILRAPNIEYLIWERLSNEAKNPFKKWYLKLLSKRLKLKELNSINRFDGFVTVSETDLNYFKNNGLNIPSTFVPIGIDVEKEKLITTITNESKNNPPTIFHLGALDWMPNQEGIDWFLTKVWPKVISEVPEAKLFIAGRRPSKSLFKWQSNSINILGEIEDAGQFIKNHDIMIVPLFSGSGMRVKIIEGMMLGKAIISTPLGAEGLKIKDGEDLLIAETAENFANAIIELITNPEKLKRIKLSAQANCKLNYSNDSLAQRFETFLNQLK